VPQLQPQRSPAYLPELTGRRTREMLRPLREMYRNKCTKCPTGRASPPPAPPLLPLPTPTLSSPLRTGAEDASAARCGDPFASTSFLRNLSAHLDGRFSLSLSLSLSRLSRDDFLNDEFRGAGSPRSRSRGRGIFLDLDPSRIERRSSNACMISHSGRVGG